MYVLPPHLISLSLRSRLLELRSPISTCLLPNPWVISPPRSSLPPACSAAASLSSSSKTRTGACDRGRPALTSRVELAGSIWPELGLCWDVAHLLERGGDSPDSGTVSAYQSVSMPSRVLVSASVVPGRSAG